MDYEALELIELMYSMIAEAKRMPLAADKCIIERDNMLAMLEDLRDNLPREMEESRRLWEAKDEFIATAKREAEQIRVAAEQQARQLIEEQSIVQQAKQQAEAILADANAKKNEVINILYGQIDNTVAESEATLASSLEQVRSIRYKLRGGAAPAAAPAPAKEQTPLAPRGYDVMNMDEFEDE